MEDTGKISLPYFEVKLDQNTFLRKFLQGTDCGEFTWHRDRENRSVKSTHPTDWKIQIENQLPKSLNEESYIPMGVWHRIIKGSGDLEVKLVKFLN